MVWELVLLNINTKQVHKVLFSISFYNKKHKNNKKKYTSIKTHEQMCPCGDSILKLKYTLVYIYNDGSNLKLYNNFTSRAVNTTLNTQSQE